MATNRIHTITTDNGTRITLTVNGEDFRIDGSRPKLSTPPIDRWTLQHELAGVKFLVVGWSMGIIAMLLICTGALLAFG